MSTCTCVFGCWKFKLYYDINEQYQTIAELNENLPYGSFVKGVVGGVTNMFWLVKSYGIEFTDTPFSWVLSMGSNPWVSGIVLVALPTVILGTGIFMQHRYYIKKYFKPDHHHQSASVN